MKGHTLGGTVIDTPLDIDTVIRVPIVLRIRRRLVCEVMTGFKWHVSFPSCLILCVVGVAVPLFMECRLNDTMRVSMQYDD